MYTIDVIVCYLFTTASGKVLMVTEEIKNQLRAVVGKEYVLDSEIDRFGYSYDSSFVSILPFLV